MIITILLSLLILATIILSVICVRSVLYPSRTSFDGSEERLEEQAILKDYSHEEFSLESSFGYTVQGEFIDKQDGLTPEDAPIVILVHGYGSYRGGMYKYAPYYLERGFRVLAYDHTNSGASGGNMTTMGFREQKDLVAIYRLAEQRYPQARKMGLMGESMGAATSLLSLTHLDELDFIVSDCAYSECFDEIAYQIHYQHRVPKFPVMYVSSLFNKIKVGAFYGSISPFKVLKQGEGKDVPILFIHGEADLFTPPSMTQDLYHAKQGKKAIYMVPEATHANSITTDPAKYELMLDSFFRSYKVLQ